MNEGEAATTTFVAGHRGLVGSALMRSLDSDKTTVLTVDRSELDLRDQAGVMDWMHTHRPDFVYIAAGTVGGIQANSTRQAEFLFDNLMIHANLIEASRRTSVTKLLYLGSSCIYPRHAPQPIPEDALLTGTLEPTNEGYALAKISGLRLCKYYRSQYGCDFISVMPTNLYGPGDNFDLESGHVLPSLIRKFHEAKLLGATKVEIWGSGTPQREFLHVDDLATACRFLMQSYSGEEHINVGSGEEVTIRELAEIVRSIVYPEATLAFDESRPDGTPRKVLDTSAIRELGWEPTVGLVAGIESTYNWFLDNQDSARGTTPPERT